MRRTRQMHRRICYDCRRAVATCYCASLRPFRSAPRIVILLHPKESRKAINTGRMVHRAIENSWLFVGCDFSDHEALNALLRAPGKQSYLLFPGPKALDLGVLREQRSIGADDLFIILDGTWSMAKKMYDQSPNLQALPQIMFSPKRPSRFAIRKQPKALCYSTIESVHHIIDELALLPQDSHHHLLEIFDEMVQRQIDYEEGPGAQRSLRGIPSYRDQAIARKRSLQSVSFEER